MGHRVLTLEELLKRLPDGVLLDLEEELLADVVPTKGETHRFCRKLNRMIDRGELRINPTQYRHIYTPALTKAVHKECARRYVCYLTRGAAPQNEEYEQLTLNI